MSLKGLRFTLHIDGLEETATAVVGFSLYQCHSTPFVLEVDIASDQPDLAATNFLEKNAVLTIWQGMEAQRYVSGIINEVALGENNHWQNRPGIDPALTRVAKEAVAESTGWHSCPVTVLHGGRAETVTLIKKLAETPLPEGAVSVLLAVDSWLSPLTLKWLEDENLLHGAHRLYNRNTRENPYGRVPSEGAAALVVTSSSGKYTPWCHIRGTGQAVEDVRYSDKGICLGAGLREAAFRALETAKITSLHHVVSDANGEPYRADELGFTLAALGEYTDGESIRETPVLASGDLGCASLLTHMGLTAWRLHASEQPDDTLLLSSSDDGQRGAIVMSGREK
ncbi:hypothetical protein CBZ99_003269 [Salmonella enterica subsp. houtenae serovar 40:z4,z24:-]|nr:hypothetical protein [Salmonella enterica subsp. houtenae serovar 40:z4,z24:-]